MVGACDFSQAKESNSGRTAFSNSARNDARMDMASPIFSFCRGGGFGVAEEEIDGGDVHGGGDEVGDGLLDFRLVVGGEIGIGMEEGF